MAETKRVEPPFAPEEIRDGAGLRAAADRIGAMITDAASAGAMLRDAYCNLFVGIGNRPDWWRRFDEASELVTLWGRPEFGAAFAEIEALFLDIRKAAAELVGSSPTIVQEQFVLGLFMFGVLVRAARRRHGEILEAALRRESGKAQNTGA